MSHHPHFGELYKLYGIVTYRVSPMHLRAYKGFLTHGFPNTIRRCVEQIPYVVPPLAIGVGIYYGADALHVQYARKNPKDYENDC